jgi:L-fucose isomerase-like protein
MANHKKCTMGLAPTRRDVFPANLRDPIVSRVKDLGSKYDVDIVGIEDVAEEGLLFKNSDIPRIAKKFIDNNVDCVFVPHANFGQEEAVAKLCKAVGKPVLLWGPRDPAPKGVISQMEDRLYDIQCGLFVSGKALSSYQVPYTYIENCWLDSQVLDQGFEDFIRSVCASRAVKNARIAQLSVRPWQFLSVRANESELLQKFGVEVTPFESSVIIEAIREVINNDKTAIEQKLSDWKARIQFSSMSDEAIRNTAAAVIGIRRLAEQQGCTAIAGECWSMLQAALGLNACFIWGALTDEGIPATCETDVLGALGSLLLLGAMRGDSIPFFADITVRHPTNDNAELLWHCGPFPPSLAKDANALVADGKGQWEIIGGDITLVRLGCDSGRYSMFAGECKSAEGPKTNGNYIWVETDNWPKWERKFVKGPYVHHVSGCHGRYQNIISEALQYIGDIHLDTV